MTELDEKIVDDIHALLEERKDRLCGLKSRSGLIDAIVNELAFLGYWRNRENQVARKWCRLLVGVVLQSWRSGVYRADTYRCGCREVVLLPEKPEEKCPEHGEYPATIDIMLE